MTKPSALGFAIGLLAFGCAGKATTDEARDSTAPPAERSPIVFGCNDPVGTFFVTLEDRNMKYVNDNYYFYPISLSPSRTRVLQMTDDPSGGPDRVVEVFPVTENAPLLMRMTIPGGFLGWANDDELVFSSFGSEGFLRVDVGGAKHELHFPDFVLRESGQSPMGSLSPDGKAVAFVLSTQDGAEPSYGDALAIFDTRTGALTDRWTIPARPIVFWASDGTILLLATGEAYTVVPGADALRGPFTLPFRPCSVDHWVEPGTVHMTEVIAQSDHETCGNSWVVRTDGSSAVPRNAPAPSAIAPDGRKVLVVETQGFTVADPDGSNPETLDLPMPHDPAW